MLQELNEKNFNESIKNGIKLVAFTAPWCGYCQKQYPILQEIAEKNIWIGLVNGDENSMITHHYGINAYPSFLLFKNGKIVAQLRGFHTKYDLLDKILKELNV